MGKEPVNILVLKRNNAQYEAAEHHAQKLLEDTGRAKWFADDFTRLGRPELTAQTKDFVAKETSLIQRHKVSLRDQIAQELEAANNVVKMERKARLKELFLRERLKYERELNAMGLAFDKCRD